MATDYDAGPLDALPDGAASMVRLGRREVVLVRRGEEVFALANRCPHQGAEMCRGRLRSELDGPSAGELRLRTEVPVLACPWHGWEFDLTTGSSVFDPRYRVKTYPVTIDGSQVRVRI
jgi:nitrite reductase/ring-hydroxylating ferredoxin subunit